MTVVKWIPIDFGFETNSNKIDPSVNLSQFPPEPAFKYLMSVRKDSLFIKCPAVSDYLKNTFVIRCPYDIILDINIANCSIYIDGYDGHTYSQEFFDSNIVLRPTPNHLDPPNLHFLPKALYITDSKDPVKLTLLPWFFKMNDISLVPGSFDISKWIRPTEPAFEVYKSGRYEFRRGDPLYCIQFETADNKVEIQRDVFTEQIKETMLACSYLKKTVPGLNLKTVYKIAEDYIELMKKRIFKSMDK